MCYGKSEATAGFTDYENPPKPRGPKRPLNIKGCRSNSIFEILMDKIIIDTVITNVFAYVFLCLLQFLWLSKHGCCLNNDSVIINEFGHICKILIW
jgi:hypothetical protein